MRFPAALLLSGMLVVPALHAENVKISGYITRVASRSDFDVNGLRVRCDSRTSSGLVIGGTMSGKPGCPQTAPYVGERARVEGSFRKSDRSIAATTIAFVHEASSEVSGSAVIDGLPRSGPSTSAKSSLLVRADGYRILITGKTLVVWVSPLHSFGDVRAGDWISYKGQQRADGIVVAEKVWLEPLAVDIREQNFRARRNFDPSKVPASAKQSAVSRHFLGVNPKRLPPYNDPQMQARVHNIGEKLIPAWQRALPDSDPAKIHFRFQVIRIKKFYAPLALASGVILVPQQVVSRMQNDAQLAAVLADNIATVLERQDYRFLPEKRAKNAGAWAADAAGIFVPGAGLLAPALCYGGGAAMDIKAEDQSGRVALGLLHDAGYDIDQAPMAWWLLSSDTPEPISKIPPPHRAAYLYRILGECWNNPGAVADRH
ncbi:MAG TPA: DUF5666 domain-containing protein [Terracidiphilus sp.]|nr:DUF5666 domain-containing protein [Terracidiphilus sp.]